jgi:hypothetical protein
MASGRKNVLRVSAAVKEGKRLEICAPELPDEGVVEVLVLLPCETAGVSPSALEVLDALPAGPRLFRDEAEVDDYVRAERGAWRS